MRLSCAKNTFFLYFMENQGRMVRLEKFCDKSGEKADNDRYDSEASGV